MSAYHFGDRGRFADYIDGGEFGSGNTHRSRPSKDDMLLLNPEPVEGGVVDD